MSALPASGSVRDGGPPSAVTSVAAELNLVAPRISKLDSRLAQVYEAGQSKGAAVARATAQEQELDGTATTVRVIVETTDVAAAKTSIAAVGGTVNGSAGDLVRADVPTARLVALTHGAGVDFVRPPATPVAESPVTDEAVASTHAGSWHGSGFNGQNVKVAVIDLGFAGYAAAQASGDVPAPAASVHDCTDAQNHDQFTSTSHGTAVAAAVHAMAPCASLTLICVLDEVDLAHAESYMKSHGITIANESLGWFNLNRGDGTGTSGTPDDTVAKAAGSPNPILWINAAGDEAKEHWSGTWVDADSTGDPGYDQNDFAPGDDNDVVHVPLGGKICAYLRWDAWPKPKANDDLDFGLLLYNTTDGDFPIQAASNTAQDGSAPPTEQFCTTNTTGTPGGFWPVATTDFQLKILYAVGDDGLTQPKTTPRFDLFVTGDASPLQYQTAAGSIVEPADSPNALAVGASCWSTGATEPYSSLGPIIGPTVGTTVAGKPEINGPDSTSNVISGPFTTCGDATSGFAGTSASAAHVTGAAALVSGHTGSPTVSIEQYLLDHAVSGNLNLPLLDPVITSFTPTSGPVGTTVTINGSALGDTSDVVTFGGGATAAPLTNTGTKLTVKVPPGAQTDTIQVARTDGGQMTTAQTFTVTPTLQPTLTTFTPASGPVGSTVTLNGTNLESIGQASLNGSEITSITIVSPTQIKVTVPPDPFFGKFQVRNAAGFSNETTATFDVTPAITSFDPVQGGHGSTVTIHGTSLEFATKVTFNGVPSGTVDSGGNTELMALVPPTATTGKIAVTTTVPLTTPPGPTLVQTGTSATSYTVIQQPKITSFSPASGPEGTVVTLSGSNLSGVTSATLTDADTGTVTHSGSQLKVTIQPGATTGLFAVTSLGGTGSSATSFKVTPRVDGFTPNHGLKGTTGKPVTINGRSFTGATKVTFNGVSAGSVGSGFIVNSDGTQITTDIPATATTGKIAVTTPSGTGTSAGTFTIVLTPTITSFTPTSAATGATVTVNGTNLLFASNVTFPGGAVAPISQAVSQSQVKVAVPAEVAASGKLTVTNDAATSAPSAGVFKLLPAVTSMETDHGRRGDTLVIHGTSFQTPLLVTKVTVNGVPVLAGGFTVDSDTQITLTVPPTATTGKIAVTTANGIGTSTASYTVVLAPTISSISPTSGPTGTLVTINGANFTYATQAAIGGAALDSFTVVGATKITGRIPAGATSNKLTVHNPAGDATSGSTFNVTPAVTSFSPDHGARSSTVVAITGTSFTGATKVTFNGVSAGAAGVGFHVVNDGQITATVPATGSSGKIAVTTPSGTGTSTTTFNVVTTKPTITSFSPSTGVSGTVVTINGTNLQFVDTVTFSGAAPASAITHVSATKITVPVPDDATTGTLTVANAVGNAVTATPFTVQPTVTSYDPTSAAAGDTVTITGANFTNEASVEFNGVPTDNAPTFDSDTELEAVVPDLATTGPVSVTVNGSTGAGPSLAILPTIASFTPTTGGTGTPVEITGTGFDSTSTVKFNGVTTTGAPQVLSATDIKVDVPGPALTGAISVTTAGGSATTSALDPGVFTVLPSIDDFEPLGTPDDTTVHHGPVGTTVVISGSGFHNGPGNAVATVTFGGVAATNVTVVSSTEIHAVVPPGAVTGFVEVTVSEGPASSDPDEFTVDPGFDWLPSG